MTTFISRLACWILSLTDKHGITLIPAYISTHLNVEAAYLSQHWLLPEWHLLPQVDQAVFLLWDLLGVDLLASSHSTLCQHYYTLESSTTSWDLGVECLQPFLDISGKLHISSYISSSGSVQVSCRTYQRSTQTFDSGGTMLDGGYLAPHSSKHVGRCSLAVPCHKRSPHGCLSRSGTQGTAISAFNPLAAQRCVLCIQGFNQQCWKEWAGGCTKQIPSLLLN